MADRPTFVDVVEAHVQRAPGALAMSWVPELARDAGERLDRGQLWQQAGRIAGGLAQLEWRPGAMRLALLAFPPGLDFLRAFIGCLRAGVVAVPVALPRRGRAAQVLEAIVGNCGATVALTSAAEGPRLRELFASSAALAPLRVLPLEELPAAGAAPAARPRPDDLAFVQYTSGSSGRPKGVCVTHANLKANLELIHRCFRITPGQLVVSWLPHYHDMGLIGSLLVPLHDGIPCVGMAPSAFVKRPLRWLQTIAAQDPDRAVISGGPNFAWQLCVDRIAPEEAQALSLRRWATAFNGAEPVRAATLKAFTERFAPAGFAADKVLTCYGLAETTLFAAGGHDPSFLGVSAAALEAGRIAAPADRAADARELVSSGPADPDRIAIVDPATRRRLPAGAVGEVWVTGPSVPARYFNDEAESARTFAATVAGDAGGARFLATGDLGAIAGGQLFVTGRAKELLIVNGRNVYPHDVELLLLGADARVTAAAVFAWNDPAATAEATIAVCELARSARHLLAPQEDGAPSRELERLADAMRRAAAPAELALAHVRFVAPMQIARTSSGKTAYGQLRREFGALPPAVRARALSARAAQDEPEGERNDGIESAAMVR